jgi:hypothetical protein
VAARVGDRSAGVSTRVSRGLDRHWWPSGRGEAFEVDDDESCALNPGIVGQFGHCQGIVSTRRNPAVLVADEYSPKSVTSVERLAMKWETRDDDVA